jgi:spermidine synthase
MTDANIQSRGNPVNRNIFFVVTLLGFGSIVTQVILLREMLNIFTGNELITGIVLASWMTLTGLGAWIGRRVQNHQTQGNSIIRLVTWLGFLPILMVVLLYSVKHYLFPAGILIDIRYIFPITLLVLSPYCILSGHLFSLLTNPPPNSSLIPNPSPKRRRESSNQRSDMRTDRLYAIETLGGVIGGLTVSFVLIFWFSGTQSLLLIAFMHLLVAYTLKQNNKNTWKYISAAAMLIVLFILPTDSWLKKLVFHNQKILQTIETPYGNVTITQSANQINVFENHELLYTTQNTIENEETVHYPMLQHPAPKNVLLVSGGTRSLIKEILKYKTLQHLDYVEENRWLLNIISGFDTILADPRLAISNIDIRKFLNKASQPLYDIVIMAVPEPSTLQTNRNYTFEFFRLLKTRISENGLISLTLPSSGNYMTPENISIHSLIVKTLKQVFPEVLIIPGEKDYILASAHQLSSQIASLAGVRGIETSYVNPYYIDDFSLGERIKLIEQSLKPIDKINQDFKPLAVYYNTNYYISKFSGKAMPFILLPLILLILPIFWLRSGASALYITGFSISALEVLLLLSFQIVFGFVYAAAGVIISACMAGLATGAIAGWRWNIAPGKYTLVLNQLIIGILAAVFTWIISKVSITWNSSILYLIFLMATLLPSVFAGFQFSQIVKQAENNTKVKASRLYAADLFGAAMGAALVSLVLLTVFGVQSVMLVIVILNLIASVLLSLKKD